MSKLHKLFLALKALLRKPGLILRVLDDNATWERRVLRDHGITSLPVVALSELFPGIQKGKIEVSPYAFLEGGSMPTDLALLRLLARNINNCRYFEIGTWRGESVMNVAAEGADCHTLNLTDTQMLAMGYSLEGVKQVGSLIRPDAKVVMHRGDSATFDYRSAGAEFDLVFIDGDHHYERVKQDTMNILNSICHETTIICWHDYAYNPESIRHEVMAGILDGVPARFHHRLVHVRNTKMAVMLAQPVKGEAFQPVQDAVPSFNLQIRILDDPPPRFEGLDRT